MKLTTMLLSSSSALAALLAAPANAQVRFTITGDYTASFVLPTSPVPPPEYVFDDYSFSLTDVAGSFGDAPGIADLTFFNGGVTGGLLISRAQPGGFVDYLFDASNFQLYAGPESAPTFRPRTQPYELQGFSTPGTFIVTIAAVPEPASWVVMIAGFALVGGAMRLRVRSSAIRYQA